MDPDPVPPHRSPLAEAFDWVSQITAIAIEIVGCIWLGRYLDDRLGTDYWAMIGLFLGPAIGFLHLLRLTGVIGSGASSRNQRIPPRSD